MNRILIALFLPIFLLITSTAGAVDDYSASVKSFKQAKQTLPFFKSAYGYALFPTIGKGGLGIGGAHGNGQVYAGGKVTGTTSMTQITIGLQAGGQAFSQIIFFKDKRAYTEFIGGNFEFGAQATAVAITAGASASASSTGTSSGATGGGGAGAQSKAKYNKGMATFTYAKGGLMYEAAIGGQKFGYEALGKKK